MSAIPPPAAHGGDGAAVARALGVDPTRLLDLSLSLNPVAPDVRPVVAHHLDDLARYPDPARATEAMAAALGLVPEQVLVTNGGAEAIAIAARLLGGGAASEPEFALHPRAPDGPRWRSNPHNPTGRLAAADATADVWDEAFYPLATGAWTRGDLERGAVVVGSLTKLFACPGLRVGYLAAADPELVARAGTEQPHWSVNGLAAAALPDLLAAARLPEWAGEIGRLRDQLRNTLATHGYEVHPSDANWVLVPAKADLRTRLARHGVLVRDCASFGLGGTVRIAVPDDAGRARLEEALWRLG